MNIECSVLTAHYGAFRRAKTTPSRCQEPSVGPFYFFGPFLGFFDFFFELAPLSDATTLLALLCCARLPGRKETVSWAVGCRSAMVSTSQATASSSSSAGCCGSVAVARSCFDLSLHRHSSVLAVLRQKTDVLSEREAAAFSAPDLSSAGTHSEHRAAHSRKKCLMSPIALHPNLHFLSSRGIPCQRPSSISVGRSPKRAIASRRAWYLLSTCERYGAPGQHVRFLLLSASSAKFCGKAR